MLVPHRCGSPYSVDGRGRVGAVGYLSPVELGLDGSQFFGEGQLYNSDLFDAAGYNTAMWLFILQGGSGDTSLDLEVHYIDPFLAVNPAPAFTFTMAYGGVNLPDPIAYAFTWGTRSQFAGVPAPGDSGFKDGGFLVCSLHISVIVAGALINPIGHLFLLNSPEPACG